MAQRNDGQITRDAILEEAAKLFAEHGYSGTRVSEICQGAGANSAAVNYYFGSKEELYREVWRQALEREANENPFDGGVAPGASSESRLRGRIAAMIHRFFHKDGTPTLFGLLQTREMANPTGHVEELRRGYFAPHFSANQELFREMLGEDATAREVLFVQTSVVHQCLAFGLRKGFHLRASEANETAQKCHPMTLLFGMLEESRGVEDLVDHVTRFSLAGIGATKAAIAKRSSGVTGS